MGISYLLLQSSVEYLVQKGYLAFVFFDMLRYLFWWSLVTYNYGLAMEHVDFILDMFTFGWPIIRICISVGNQIEMYDWLEGHLKRLHLLLQCLWSKKVCYCFRSLVFHPNLRSIKMCIIVIHFMVSRVRIIKFDSDCDYFF